MAATLEMAGRPPALAAWRVWSRHLLCFVLPLTTLAFAVTAPHPWWGALAFFAVLVASVVVDDRAAAERRQPEPALPGWPFDGVLYLLVALHVANVWLLLDMVARHGFWRFDTLIGWQLLGVTAGYSGIVVAHELMHRHGRAQKLLARVLMSRVV
jgi:alkane 1-monooxygenase